MFSYIDQDSWLHRRNPTMKFVLMLAVTVVICLSYYPILPISTVVLIVALTCIGGRISPKVFLGQLKAFIFIAAVFMVSMTVLRGLSYSPDTLYAWGPFTWSRMDLINILTLGFRIMAFVAMSVAFVATTRPRDIVLSLIGQCKLDPVRGFAIMAAYRFLPELQDHVQTIRLAQRIRGIESNDGLLNRLASPFRLILPLFCLAARRGDSIACAMESRGLGGTERTYCHEARIDSGDWVFAAGVVVVYAALIIALVYMGAFHFSVNVQTFGR
ncbi:energy-coupling factor transporter transmembrane component T family protein [Slackia heliotrinireducens]|uniref:energy-coupling factor transporter transmembrane component T family protein n=1 Tax=Slackia heliotrinireducens TaxID=84110 RepID=UPI00331489B8